ncbi:MAG: hypothetical protein WEA04_01580 [Candidatus Andersenbacteria bacterium]
MENKRLARIALVVGLLLLLPLFGNIFIDGWNWSFGDFLVMGSLLFGTGFAIDLAVRKIANSVHRFIVIIAILLAFLLIWAGMVANVGERLLEQVLCGGVC